MVEKRSVQSFGVKLKYPASSSMQKFLKGAILKFFVQKNFEGGFLEFFLKILAN